jgi:hypothetical protein
VFINKLADICDPLLGLSCIIYLIGSQSAMGAIHPIKELGIQFPLLLIYCLGLYLLLLDKN